MRGVSCHVSNDITLPGRSANTDFIMTFVTSSDFNNSVQGNNNDNNNRELVIA